MQNQCAPFCCHRLPINARRLLKRKEKHLHENRAVLFFIRCKCCNINKNKNMNDIETLKAILLSCFLFTAFSGVLLYAVMLAGKRADERQSKIDAECLTKKDLE